MVEVVDLNSTTVYHILLIYTVDSYDDYYLNNETSTYLHFRHFSPVRTSCVTNFTCSTWIRSEVLNKMSFPRYEETGSSSLGELGCSDRSPGDTLGRQGGRFPMILRGDHPWIGSVQSLPLFTMSTRSRQTPFLLFHLCWVPLTP